MIYMLVVFNKTAKSTGKRKKKRHEEEQLNKIIAAKKDELEIMVNQRTAEILKQKKNSKTPGRTQSYTIATYTLRKNGFLGENLPQGLPMKFKPA